MEPCGDHTTFYRPLAQHNAFRSRLLVSGQNGTAIPSPTFSIKSSHDWYADYLFGSNITGLVREMYSEVTNSRDVCTTSAAERVNNNKKGKRWSWPVDSTRAHNISGT